ncbi:MAG TPA: antibiotic biosynthesis monooxygenase [Solirubrobacteraceae bacterium]|nr:antibiotic biosynthesis monooxygenase [Solirubrobacteraceae bacterium]
MEAVITRVVLNGGAEAEWEATMRDRMKAAEASAGWIGGALLAPEGDGGARVIVGLWETREDWQRWHDDPAFRETAERLRGLESDAGTATWHDAVYAGGRLTDR